MEDCIFCKIIGGEIPSFRVFEDERVVAFLDLMQPERAVGHVLVMPREHVEHIYEAESALLGHLFDVTRRVGIAVKEACGADGILVWQRNEEAAGQVIPHLHIHVFPRFHGDAWDLFAGKLPPQASTDVLAEARDAIAGLLR